jgi:glycine/serine hydroxymethyltransferase
MKEVSGIIGEILRSPNDDRAKESARARVAELTARFPVYPV